MLARLLSEDAVIPARQTEGAAGYDLVAIAFGDARAPSLRLAPGARVLAWTGVAIALPERTVGLVCPRSGLAVKHGLTVLNGPGVVDEDYRGELGVPLVNLGDAAVDLEKGMRVAQLVVVRCETPAVTVTTELSTTRRGGGGFGSTGGGSGV